MQRSLSAEVGLRESVNERRRWSIGSAFCERERLQMALLSREWRVFYFFLLRCHDSIENDVFPIYSGDA